MEVSSTYTDDNLLVLFGPVIEIWDFQDPRNISKVRTLAANPGFEAGYFFNHFITQCLHHPSDDTHELNVWKYEKDASELVHHIHIEDFDNFTLMQNGERVSYKYSDAVFIGSCFLVTCQVPFPGEPFILRSLSVRILTDSGLLIRELFMPQFDPDASIGVFIRGSRLLLGVEDHMIICQQTLEEIGDVTNKNRMEFRRINHLPGRVDVMLTKTEATSVRVVNFFGGMQMLRVTKLDFWNTV